MCWIDIYLGPLDVVTREAEKQLMARAFQANSSLLHIATKSVPVDCSNAMIFVERYHLHLRRAFNIIKSEALDLDYEEALHLAVKSINDPAGPDGLVPTLLVYGAHPRLELPTKIPAPSMIQRASALRKATADMAVHLCYSQVLRSIAFRNGLDTTDIKNAPINSLMLVYRPELCEWDSLYHLRWTDEEDCYMLLPPPSGLMKFCLNVIRCYMEPETRNPTALLTFASNHAHSLITNIDSLTFEFSIAPNYEYSTIALTSTIRETTCVHTNETTKIQKSRLKQTT